MNTGSQSEILLNLIGQIEELEGRVPADEELEALARCIHITHDLAIYLWRGVPIFSVSRRDRKIVPLGKSVPVFHTFL